jgi:deazaflavin-dependent oxidoreductase (nitroreductase family)
MTNPVTQIPRAPFFVRFFNRIIRGMLRIGMPVGPMILLTVRGRKTGRLRTTPVGLFELDGRRYLLSTFGKVNWVHNLRASGEVILSHGRYKSTAVAVELSPEEAAPVLKGVFAPYLRSLVMWRILRSWYNVTPDTPSASYINVAENHPVFELHETRPAA